MNYDKENYIYFLAIIICTLGTISSNAVECQAHEYQNEEKIDSRLKEKLETMNDDDIVRVWIWFNGIDESKLASNVKQRCGFEEKDFEISVSESHIEAAVLLESDRNNFQSSTVEKIVEEYKKDNVLFNEKIKENFNNFSVEYRSAYSKNILTMDPLPITLRGDINLDVNITIIDATLLQKILAGYSDINSDIFDELYYTGDTNSDGEIDVNDVTTIQKYLVKQIDIPD